MPTPVASNILLCSPTCSPSCSRSRQRAPNLGRSPDAPGHGLVRDHRLVGNAQPLVVLSPRTLDIPPFALWMKLPSRHSRGRQKLPARHRRRGRSTRTVLLSGAAWNSSQFLIGVAGGIVLTPFLVDRLGLVQYGVFALVNTINSFVSTFDGGLGATVGRYCAVYAGTDDETSTSRLIATVGIGIFLLGSLVSAGAWFLAPTLVSLFSIQRTLAPAAIFMLRICGPLVAAAYVRSLFAAVVNARQRYRLTSLAQVLSYCAGSVGMVVALELHAGLRGVALAMVGQQVLATSMIIPSAAHYLHLRSLRPMGRREIRSLSRFAGSVQLQSVSGLINNEVDALLIGVVSSVGAVANYNAASNFGYQLRYLATNLLSPVSTHLASTYGRSGEEGLLTEYSRIQRTWITGVTGMFSVAAAASYFGIVAWLGHSFQLAGELAVMLVLSHMINLYTALLTIFCSAVGRPDVELRYGLMAVTVNLVLTGPMLLLGPRGIVGASCIGTVLGSAYFFRLVRKRLRSDIPGVLRDVPFISAASAALVTVGIEYAISHHIPKGPVGLLACSLPALLGLAVFACLSFGPRQSVRFLRVLSKQRALGG